MSYPSILFSSPDDARAAAESKVPAHFADLNLDQVVSAVTEGRRVYDLEPFFRLPLRSTDAVAYRHEVLRDLEDPGLRSTVEAFAHGMRDTRIRLVQADKRRYLYQHDSWFLDAVKTYSGAVRALTEGLGRAQCGSRGFTALRDHLDAYTRSPAFLALGAEAGEVDSLLAGVRYTLRIGSSRIEVATYQGEPDHGAEVLSVFEKFKQGQAQDYLVALPSLADMNHVEAEVLDRVAQLYPQAFAALTGFAEHHQDFQDPCVRAFDREVQFYLAYTEFTGRQEAAGLPYCYPQVSDRSKEVMGQEVFDLALADKLLTAGEPVVCNDFFLEGPQRLFVVTGPNQGGKTTFARTFGQMHHLAALGCTVPGSQARLHLPDQILTHFEREEDLGDLSGKLQDELLRMHAILDRATGDTVVIMNETFTSTTLHDALLLGTRVLEKLTALDVLGVCVTFVDELASLSEHTVSMVSSVDPDDPATRTYKLARRPADGLAHAVAIAEKYALAYPQLKQRIAS